jgi:hypothetical protein
MVVGSRQREETNAVRREGRRAARGWPAAHQRRGVAVMIQPKHVPELMRDDVAHRVRQREGRNVRPTESYNASTSRPPAHTERNQVGLRQRDHNVCGFIGERPEEPSGCRPAAEDCLAAGGTQQLVRNRVGAMVAESKWMRRPRRRSSRFQYATASRAGGTRGSVGSPMILTRRRGRAVSRSSAAVSTRPESRQDRQLQYSLGSCRAEFRRFQN